MIFTVATEEEVELLNKTIIDYNLSKVPYNKNPPWEELNYILKNNEGLMIGGVTSALIMNNVLSIDVLVVKEDYRKLKYGSMLLNKVEQEAKDKGAYLAQLDTFDFQALPFYLKHDYEVFGTLTDCPAPSCKRYYLKKKL